MSNITDEDMERASRYVWERNKAQRRSDTINTVLGLITLLFGVIAINLVATLFGDNTVYRIAFIVCGVFSYCMLWSKIYSNVEVETLKTMMKYHELSNGYSELDLNEKIRLLGADLIELRNKIEHGNDEGDGKDD